jgi:hypothetical protein
MINLVKYTGTIQNVAKGIMAAARRNNDQNIILMWTFHLHHIAMPKVDTSG